MVALVGGGGKTSTMYALAHEARALGRTVLVTTTTHIMPHPGLPLTDKLSAVPALLQTCGAVTLGRFDRPDKLSGVGDPETYKALADTVVVEADGARTLPLKAPAAHEPVIPACADAVVACAGLDSLGKPIGRTCHRPELVCALLGVDAAHVVTPADVAEILASPHGGRKSVGEGMDFRCLLNKADTAGLRTAGAVIAGLLAQRGIFACVHSYPERERGGKCWF